MALVLGFIVGCAALVDGRPALAQQPAAQAATAPVAVRVATVEALDPCEKKRQRQEAVNKAFANALKGALIVTAAEGLRSIIKNMGKKEGEKKEKARLAEAAAAGAVIGGIIGYRQGLDSARRQCDLFQVAQRRSLTAQFEQIALLPVQDVAAVDPLPEPAAVAESTPAEVKGGKPKHDKPARKPQKSQADYDEKDLVFASVSTFTDAGSFAPGSAMLTPEAKAHFAELAQQYSPAVQEQSARATYRAASEQYRQRVTEDQEIDNLRKEWAALRVVLIGHTDDTGDSPANARLSEARARAVADLFRAQGVPAERLYYQGAGSSLPIADNRSEAGRAANRRVEVMELPPGADVAQYLSLRRANPALNRPLPPVTVAAQQPVAPAARPAAPKPAAPKPAASTGGWEIPTAAAPPAAGAKPATKQPAATAQAPRKPAILPELAVDFAGKPIAPDALTTIASLVGPPRPKSGGWGFISTAHASEGTFLGTACTQDSATQNLGLPVKQLADDKPVYRTNEYLPGLYDTVWKGSVNGHEVALTHVAVLRDGNEPVVNPDVLVYKDFNPDAPGTATLSLRGKAKVYEGSGALLYRVFVEGSRMRCVDLVLPYKGGFTAQAGALYYDQRGVMMTADYKPAMLRR